MNFKSMANAHQNSHELNRKPIPRFIIITFLFVTAIGVRLYHIDKPPLDFSAIRQYQSAHIIRGIYYKSNDSISESRKHIAKLNMERMGFELEPRIIENASVVGYRLMGAEHLWIPRVLSSIFWVVGGFFLYLIALKFFSPGISLFSTFFYLFHPFGILASRSIQPESLMVMMMLCSIYAVLKYDEKPSLINLIAASIITAMAVLIKPYCVFIIFGAFFSLAVLRMGFFKASFNRNTFIFALVIILPGIFYYLYNMLSDTGFLEYHMQGSFLPHLIVYASFWGGWLLMIGNAVGYIAFFFALIGLFKIEYHTPKAMLLGLWVGYFVFGLSATYQIHTHNYYSLPLMPIVALSLGPIAAIIIERGNLLISQHVKKLILICVFFIIVPALGLSMGKLTLRNMLSDYKSELKFAGAFIGVDMEFKKYLSDDFANEVRISKEIGEHVGHSANTVFLTPYFGRDLAYYGELAGFPWPTSESLYKRKLKGEIVPDIEKDFTSKYIVLLYKGKLIKHTPDFFIITAFNEFDKQVELRKFLYANFPVFVQNKEYLIFDLRKMSE